MVKYNASRKTEGKDKSMKRILLKLSGEALAGPKKTGFDEKTVLAVAKQIRTIAEEGTQVGIVIGGEFLERTYQRDDQPE